ncbi:MAG: hypothetical protein GX540_04335 [Clostridiales bacterium]|nr:hypothetical protein [Clostridiales bacterium]
MLFCGKCRRPMGRVRAGKGRWVPVELCPIPYLKNEEGSLELITREGGQVRGSPCVWDARQGAGYQQHYCGKKEETTCTDGETL